MGLFSAGYMEIVNRDLGGLIDIFCRGFLLFWKRPRAFLLTAAMHRMDGSTGGINAGKGKVWRGLIGSDDAVNSGNCV